MSKLFRCVLAVMAGAMTLVQAKDPTQPPDWHAAGVPDSKPQVQGLALKLSSIIVQGKRRQVLINGRWLKQGDWLGEWQLVAIEPAAVWLERAGVTERVALPNLNNPPATGN